MIQRGPRRLVGRSPTKGGKVRRDQEGIEEGIYTLVDAGISYNNDME